MTGTNDATVVLTFAALTVKGVSYTSGRKREEKHLPLSGVTGNTNDSSNPEKLFQTVCTIISHACSDKWQYIKFKAPTRSGFKREHFPGHSHVRTCDRTQDVNGKFYICNNRWSWNCIPINSVPNGRLTRESMWTIYSPYAQLSQDWCVILLYGIMREFSARCFMTLFGLRVCN